jgi:hypothetical protein
MANSGGRLLTTTLIVGGCVLLGIVAMILVYREPIKAEKKYPMARNLWVAPDTSQIPKGPEGQLIRYGRDLIARTSYYLGPNGTVSKSTNGMNCQNCHLDAGTRPFGNNYGSVASLYPKFRARSGGPESKGEAALNFAKRQRTDLQKYIFSRVKLSHLPMLEIILDKSGSVYDKLYGIQN